MMVAIHHGYGVDPYRGKFVRYLTLDVLGRAACTVVRRRAEVVGA